MQEELFFEGIKYISIPDAASSSGLSRDHVTRLCRTGKINGQRIGKNWFVAEQSLNSFIAARRESIRERRNNLAQLRKSEYENLHTKNILPHADPITPGESGSATLPAEAPASGNGIMEQLSHALNAPAGVSHTALSLVHVPVATITPFMELTHRLLAVAFSLVLVLGIYDFIAPASAHALFAGVQAGMHDDRHALADLYDDASHIDPQQTLSGVMHSGDGEFAAAAVANPSTFWRSFGSNLASIFSSIGSLIVPYENDLASLIFSPPAITTSQDVADSSNSKSIPASQQHASSAIQAPIHARDKEAAAQNFPPAVAPAQAQTTVIETADLSGYVTQDSLAAQLGDFESRISRQFIPSVLPASPPGTAGGFGNSFSQVSNIGSLSGVTISNPTISGTVSGLTAASVPALQSLNGLLTIGQGGTGTSTAPGANRLLLSDGNGNWEYAATSSLGFSTVTSLAALTDVALAAPSYGSLLSFNGTSWTNIATSSLNISGLTQWTTSGSNLSYSSGNIGIGTTSPLTTFSVQGAPGANDLLNIASSTGSSILYVNAAGNVGIDTTSPTTPLDIRGTTDQYSFQVPTTGSARYVRAGAGLASYAGYNLGLINLTGTYDNFNTVGLGAQVGAYNDAGWNTAASTPGDLFLATTPAGSLSTTPRFFVNSSGLVGIGTWSTASEPQNQLDIKISQEATAKTAAFSTLNLNNTATSTTNSIVKSGLQVSSTGSWTGTGSKNIGLYLSSVTGGTSNYGIYDSSGANDYFGSSVGIGTTTPGSILSINNVANFTTATSTFYGNGLNLTAGCFAINGSCIGQTAASSTLLSDNNTFSGNDIFTKSLNLSGTTGTTTIAAGQGFTIGGSQFVVQQGSGKVGIGTTTPDSGLVVEAPMSTFTTKGVSNIRLGNNGTNAPTIALDNGSHVFSFDDYAPGGNLRVVYDGSAVPLQLSSGGNLTIAGNVVSNGAATTVFNAGGGNFGIGTSTPTAIFVAQGSVGTALTTLGVSNLRLGNNGTTPTLILDNGSNTFAFDYYGAQDDLRILHNSSTVPFAINGTTGNVGIGTTTPGSLLSINNVANFTAATSTFYSTGGINLAAGCYAINGVCTLSSDPNWLETAGYLTPTSTVGVIINASSTIGNGTLGLTINGAATTTGNLSVQGASSTFPEDIGYTTAGSQVKVLGFTYTPSFAYTNYITSASGGSVGQNILGFYVKNAANSNYVEPLQLADNAVTVNENLILSQATGINISGRSPAGELEVGTSSTSNVPMVVMSNGTYQNTIQDSYNGATDAFNNMSFLVTNHSGVNQSLLTLYGNGVSNFPAGNVGIGTTTPGSLLSLNNIANFTAATSTFYGNGLNLTAGCYAINGTCVGQTAASSTLLTDNNTFSGGNLFTASTTIGNGNQNGGLTINGGATTTGNAYFAGNVGIGTASPDAALQVNGSIHIGTDVNKGIISYTTNILSFNNNGNNQLVLGNSIGTLGNWSGNYTLKVAGGGAGNSNRVGTSLTIGPGESTGNGAGAPLIFEYAPTGSSGAQQNALVEGMRLDSTGKVGIGTTTPDALLTLSANNASTYPDNNLFEIASSTSNSTTTLFSVSNTGNVIIGGSGSGILTLNNTEGPVLSGATASYDFGTGSGNTGSVYVNIAGSRVFGFNNAGNFETATGVSGWASGSSPSSADTGFSRLSAGVIGIGTGAQGSTAGTLVANSIGIGTTTPFGELSISANNGTNYPGNLLFNIASSTSNSTTTLFSVSNTGNTTLAGTLNIGSLTSISSAASYSIISYSGSLGLWFGSGGGMGIRGNAYGMGSTNFLSWTSAANNFYNATQDTSLSRIAAGTLAIGTGAQGSTAGTLIAGSIGIGTTTPFALLHLVGGSTGNALEIDSSASAASTTMLTMSNAGLFSIGDDNSYSSGIFSVDASSSTTTISNLSVGNITFDTDAGVVNLSDLPVDSNAAIGTLESQSINIGGNPLITAYGVSNGSGGLQNFGVGIGTSTTPYAMLEVWGPDVASSTPVFSVVNNASTTEFTVFDGGNAQLAGTLTQNSDERLKTNIASLDASTSLSLLNALNPVTFNWIDTNQGSTPQIGFIAQQVQPVFPNLVSTTSPTALTPNGTLGVNYIGFIAPIISAIQELTARIVALETAVAQFASLITTHEVDTQKLCVGSVCVTQAQFLAMVQAANQSGSSPSAGVNGALSHSTSTPATAPVISVNGNNPATVQVGDTYTDLGATITGPQSDLNLGISASVDGGATTTLSDITIDTSTPGTHTIVYSATDQNGLTGTATRTVNVVAPQSDDSSDASSSDATSTEQ